MTAFSALNGIRAGDGTVRICYAVGAVSTSVQAVPALSELGLLLAALGIGAGAVGALRRGKRR
ncbi:MAG: IPTL-CTERM sorting domain-containing protein [Ottowia sp.]|uniref:IPTL-CTERM sorting domain-containing protein n=1 Tax=Ottowia sp. TaxID=1898956 RepID=UPI001DE826C9|nr:IPTL-CTERM sorting domain-containing protein [Ottowia sp.]MCP5259368.1 IPTL-CTERM sorting domain-containing protein [Burkholderiaceae bacterium]MCB2024287.1 IPTL-CTERM sorting domain-containing protein [Ottowia sp.]MCB2033476.1 IPTL-CTERM sorting domain-containing protein [Ottowia sp.]MCB2036099.1 IPTL-CTERM sorting domain-containing protein [Ottowia sp.]MCB2070445.1 IPTL-CTERM sorting domain-containing protein [Ottowia sp.]